jgi:hypothetical protein
VVLSLLLSRVCSTRIHGSRLSDNCTWRKRVLSLKHRRRNKPEQNHRAQQSPHEYDWPPGNENVHTRTSGDEGPLAIVAIILRKSDASFLEDRAHMIVTDVFCLEPLSTAPHPVLI